MIVLLCFRVGCNQNDDNDDDNDNKIIHPFVHIVGAGGVIRAPPMDRPAGSTATLPIPILLYYFYYYYNF
jgi:hypothetical protein